MLKPSDFLGRWSIDRSITEAHAPNPARFVGSATITEGPVVWVFAEEGTLSLAQGSTMKAERKYLWKSVGNGFDVFFADERFFHRFDLTAQAQASHWCDPDQYDVAYDFSAWPVWSSTWNVAGPRKDYVMQSSFLRLP
ncbi:DUF6314 family protein [Planktotalea sp.]|uniref:DUF6314 family protein n=1 Tax=Planktotalea sp. TaxID=2029877 RepID=UPI003299093D